MNGRFILINALHTDAFVDCRIPQSTSIPLDKLKQAAAGLDKNSEIIIHCASEECPVGRQVCHLLMNLGFTNVRELEGGIRTWKHKGLPTEGYCQAAYLKPPFGKPLPHDPKVKIITAEELKKKLGI